MGQHVVKAFVFQVEVEVLTNVRLGQENLEAHAPKHPVEVGEEEKKFLHETAIIPSTCVKCVSRDTTDKQTDRQTDLSVSLL